MKKAIVVLNGSPCKYDFDDGFIICCDGALNYLNALGVKYDLILGDFDSLGYIPENAEVFPKEKDYTDGELALQKCLENKFDKVDFICSGGGRDDHFFGNIALLRQAFERGLDARLFTEYSVMKIVSDSFSETVNIGTIVSVIALENSVVKESFGLKYPYFNTTLLPSFTLGLSNETTENTFKIDLESGLVLVIVNR